MLLRKPCSLLILLWLLVAAVHVYSKESLSVADKYYKLKEKECISKVCVDSMFKWIYIISYDQLNLADSLGKDFLLYAQNRPKVNYLNAKALLLQGSLAQAEGDHIKTIEVVLASLKLLNTDTPGIDACFAYQILSTAYNNVNRIDLSNEAAKKALKMALALNNNILIGNSYTSLGTSYNKEKKYEQAKDIFRKLIPIHLKANSLNELAKTYSNIGVSCRKMQQYDSAVFYNKKALEIATKNNRWYDMAFALHEIGFAFNLKKEYDSALPYLLDAADIREQLNETDELVWTYVNLGMYYTAKDDMAKAKANYLKALHLAIKNSNDGQRYEIYEQLANLFFQFDIPDSAYYYNIRHIKLYDSVLQTEKQLSTDALIASYELDEKENNILLLKEKEHIHTLQIQRQRIILFIAVLGIIALACITILSIRLRKQRTNKLLMEKALAEEAAKRLAIETVQKEKERIARDLHDNVGGQLSYIIYSLDGINEEDGEKRSEVTQSINESVRSVIGSLRETIWAISDANINIQDFSDKLKVFVRNIFNRTEVKIHFIEDLQTQRELNALVGLNLYRICQEIVNNAFKHAQANVLKIHIRSVEDEFSIHISDNGIGFDSSVSRKERYGLQNIRKRAAEFGIDLLLDTEKNAGTSYTLIV